MSIFVKQIFFAFVAKLFLANFGSRRVFVSLFWVSQGFCQLIFGLATFFLAYFGSRSVFVQLVLDLAGFLSADFGSRKVFGSLFWV